MNPEILAGPIKLYHAPVGEAEPLPPSDAPGGPWTLIADNSLNPNADPQVSKDGLNVAITDERDEIEVMNSLYPVKEYRTSARKKFEVKLKDMRLETLALLIGNAVVDTAAVTGVKGYRRLSSEMSFIVPEYALLVVGYAPYEVDEDDYGLNYWEPRVTFKGPGAYDHKLSTPIDVTLMINCLVHPTLGLGYTTANYAAAL